MLRFGPTLLATLIVLCLSGAPESLAARHVSPSLQNQMAIMLSVFVALLTVIMALVKSPADQWRAVRSGWPFLAFAGLALASTLWSILPAATLMGAFQASAFIVAGVMLAALCQWREIVAGIATACCILGAISLLTVPFGGLMTEMHVGALRGPFLEKNEAGAMLALGITACAALALTAPKRTMWAAGALFLFVPLVLTQSTTSIAAMVAAVSVLILIEVVRRGPVRLLLGSWALLVCAGLLASYISLNLPDVLAAMGEDSSFTGRSNVWPGVVDRIRARPLTGYGYSAFWEPGSIPKEWLWVEARFEAMNAHNSVLELALGLGLPAVALIGWAAFRTAGIGISKIYGGDDPRRQVLGLLMLILVIGLTESVLGGPNGLLWLGFIALSVRAGMPRQAKTPILQKSLREMSIFT